MRVSWSSIGPGVLRRWRIRWLGRMRPSAWRCSPVSSPTSVLTPGAFGASRVAVGHETDQRLVLFVSDDDPNSPAVTVWHMAQAKAGRSGPGNWPDPQWTGIGSGLGSLDTQLGTPVIGYDVHNAINVFVAVFDPNVLSRPQYGDRGGQRPVVGLAEPRWQRAACVPAGRGCQPRWAPRGVRPGWVGCAAQLAEHAGRRVVWPGQPRHARARRGLRRGGRQRWRSGRKPGRLPAGRGRRLRSAPAPDIADRAGKRLGGVDRSRWRRRVIPFDWLRGRASRNSGDRRQRERLPGGIPRRGQ